MTSAGPTVIVVVIAVLVVARIAIPALLRHLANRRDGVTAAVLGLRITQTEIIDGYRRAAPRYPLAGAHAELNQGAIVRAQVIVRGEWGHLMRDVAVRPNSARTASLVDFVETVNHLATRA